MAHANWFNQAKHSDIKVTISEGDASHDSGARQFSLHKFPLISHSAYFEKNIPVPEPGTLPGPVEMKISYFPGGPSAFELVAKYCYGLDTAITVENIAPTYCAARVLEVPELENKTEEFIHTFVLADVVRSATVLRITAGIANMTEAMMAGLVGNCINAIASRFQPVAELNLLPPECFVVVVKTARDMGAQKSALEASVLGFLKSHNGPDATAPHLSVEDFLNVVAASGKLDVPAHCEALYAYLSHMLQEYKLDTDAEALCRGLHELGFWVSRSARVGDVCAPLCSSPTPCCSPLRPVFLTKLQLPCPLPLVPPPQVNLPHAIIEEAYRDKNIPDRYCTVALMAENRHLITANEGLKAMVEQMHEALSAMSGGGIGKGE
jgi:hypothetical protein